MGGFNNYNPKPIMPGYVDHEGDYEVMVLDLKEGRTPDGSYYKQVICKINYPGEPKISIFLTEGNNFDGQFTAFCDTFGLQRGDQNFGSWRGHRGFIHIMLTKKDGFVNMVPRWILDDNGYVRKGKPVTDNTQQPADVEQPYGQITNDEDWGAIPF